MEMEGGMEKEAERMNAANDYYDSVVSNANLQAARRMGAAQSGAGAIDGDWQDKSPSLQRSMPRTPEQ